MNPETRALVSTTVCHGFVHILELAYGALLAAIAIEFGASLLVLGVLANVFGLAFGFTALPSGFLADRVGERRLLATCCLVSGLAAVGVGLANNVYVLGVSLMFLGLALGLYHPSGAAFVARTCRRTGLSFGYLGIGGNLGIALAPVLAGGIAALLGWRMVYVVMAIPMFLLALAFTLWLRGIHQTERQSPLEPTPEKASVQTAVVSLVLILVAQVLNGFIYRAVVTFLPLYLGQGVGYAGHGSVILLAGSVTTLVLLFGVGGQFFGGYLSERIRPEILALVVCLGSFPLLIVIGVSYGLVLVVTACFFAAFHFMGQPVFNLLVSNYSPSGWRGRVFGFSFFCNFGLGSFSAGMLGYVADRAGLNWVFIASSVFALLALAAVLVILLRYRAKGY